MILFPGLQVSDAVAGVAIGVMTRHDDDSDSLDYRLLTDLMVFILLFAFCLLFPLMHCWYCLCL